MAPEDDFPTKPQRNSEEWPGSIGYQIEAASGYGRQSAQKPTPGLSRTGALASANAYVGRRARLTEAFSDIGPRAQEILCRIAERLAKGAKQYGGDFDDKPRDWNAEALEEMLDCSVYLTMAAMKQEEAKAADKARAEAANRGAKAETFPPLQDAGRLDPRDGGA